MCIHGYSGYNDYGICVDTELDTNFFQNGYRIQDWIQIFFKVDTGYRIGYEISLILVDTVSGTGYMYPDIPDSIRQTSLTMAPKDETAIQ